MVLSEGFEGAWPQSASSSADPGAWATGVDGVAQEIVGQSGLAWRRDVIYLGSQAVAEIDANGVHELHSDHLGSPRLITKGAGTWASSLLGTAEATQAYGPYGELLSQTGSYLPTTGYTGHLQTDASGLIYMRGRYYSPAWHAFVNSDQGADPGQWNQRAYVGGSPFMGTDPSGMAENRVDCVGGLVTIDGMPNGQRCTGGSTGGGPIIYNDWDWPPDPKISPSTMLLQLLMASSRNININILRVEFYAGGVAPQTPKPDKTSKYWDCIQANFASTGITKDFMLGLANGASAVLDPTGLTGIAIGTAQLNDLSTNSAMDNGIGAMSLGAGTAGFVNQIRQINGAGRALGWAGRTVTASTWIRGVPGLNKALAAVSAVSSAVTIGAKALALHEHCSKEAGL